MRELSGKPQVTYPTRIPMKVMGRLGELQAAMVVELIHAHLGPQEGDLEGGAQCKGAYISYTFWVTLPHGEAEAPLREAIQRLPGVVLQL